MPDFSSTIPMKVKNGMASIVSLESCCHIRFGSVPSSDQSRLMTPPESGASSTPMIKKNSPFAASAKATG